MNTRGGLECYSHPNTYYTPSVVSYNSGWVTWFADYTTVSTVSKRLFPVRTHSANLHQSCQHQWMREFAASLISKEQREFHSLISIQQRFSYPPASFARYGSLTEKELAFFLSRCYTRESLPSGFVYRDHTWDSLFLWLALLLTLLAAHLYSVSLLSAGYGFIAALASVAVHLYLASIG